MPTTSTPPWNGPRNGLIGDASAIATSGHINQFLGTHPDTVIYPGASILTPVGQNANPWSLSLLSQDIEQPFTMSGTAIGRVQVPLLPVGRGADLLVSLCANSSGTPGSVITQARIPAAWITQLAATEGLDSAGPLATAPGTAMAFGGWQSLPWSPPAISTTSSLATAQLAQSGDYFVFAGGVNLNTNNSSATVAAITWAGGATVSAPALGPQLPAPLLSGGLAATSDSLCYAGGVITVGFTSNTVQSAVYLASWDSATGQIGSWSVQAALPQALVNIGMAAHIPTGTVYVVGGSSNYAPATALVSTVHYAAVANGQITAWNAAPPLPVAVGAPTVAVIGHWLIAAGGYLSNGNGSPAVYYAPIDADTGVPGNWVPGPSVPAGLYVESPTAVADSAIVWPQTLSLATQVVAQDTLTLTWDEHGPGVWTHQIGPLPALNSDQVAAVVSTGSGTYQVFNFQYSDYLTAAITTTPMISVPLPATGLTNGAIYHLLLQQQGGDLNNYLTTSTDSDLFPGNPTLAASARGAYVWTTAPAAGTAVPLQLFNLSTPAAPTVPLHTWEDGGAKITAYPATTTPDLSVLGICEAVRQEYAQNSNTGFESGIAPWTVTGGTVVQSAVHTAGVSAFSAQLTPSGSAASVYLQSEMLTCMPGQSITTEARMWFTSSVTGNASASVNWYTLAGVYLSTSSNNLSAPAATWTDLVNVFITPAGAYRYTINPALSGTPAAAQVFYVDSARGFPTITGPQLSTATALDYAGTWPAPNQPSGTTQLA